VTVHASPIETDSPDLKDDPYYNYIKSQRSAFFDRLKTELDKVNSFYLQKEAELRVRQRSLVEQKRIIQARGLSANVMAPYASLHEAFVKLHSDINKLQAYHFTPVETVVGVRGTECHWIQKDP
jgi:SPX domain protein involved in polyphosphate accumulation